MTGSGRLPPGEHAGLFFRSLWIQGSWSFRSMQALGFFFTLAPYLSRRAADPPSALKREMAFFNTHPVLACYLAGVVARLERDGEGQKALEARAALMGPLGAIGDRMFWGTLRPIAALLGATVAFADPWAGAAVLLLAWNLPAMWTRWSLIRAGYENAYDPVTGILSRPQRDWPERLTPFLPPLVAFLLGLAGARFHGLPLAAAIFAASLLLFSRGWGTGRVLAAMLAAVAALGWTAPLILERMGMTWSPWR